MSAVPVVAHSVKMHLRSASPKAKDSRVRCILLITHTFVDSHSLVARLQSELAQLSQLRDRLFPDQNVDDLLNLSREQLVRRALALLHVSAPPSDPSPSSNTPADIVSMHGPSPDRTSHLLAGTPAATHGPIHARLSERSPSTGANGTPNPLFDGSSASLDALEHLPDLHPSFDEATRRRHTDHGISDDVNGLSLSTHQNSSYVGVSSIQAALKAIFTISPAARVHVSNASLASVNPSRVPSPLPDQHSSSTLPSPDIAHRLIDSFFARVHPLVPLVDEDSFRHTFLYLNRRDAPWLALLNVVLALGSLAAGTCHDHDHLLYYRRADFHLQAEGFGSGDLHILQAYGLIAGYYLHWLNRPNEGSAMMGATLRMASAMGLHREFAVGGSSIDGQKQIETRRRIWWCLVTMDTWANMTTGRPSLGRIGLGVTVETPTVPECTNNAQYLASLKMLPLTHNVKFCILATRIQDRLAASHILDLEEIATVDAQLIQWHNDLPPVLRDAGQLAKHNQSHVGEAFPNGAVSTASQEAFSKSTSHHSSQTACPDILRTPRLVIHWWYLTLRILLYRPYLLTASLRGHPRVVSSAGEAAAVDKCCDIAGEMIENINFACPGELIAGWNAVWLMYQAVMVPLLSLYSRRRLRLSPSDTRNGAGVMFTQGQCDNDHGSVRESWASRDQQDKVVWSNQVEMAIRFFDRLSPFSIAAGKSKAVVESLYECSRCDEGSNTTSDPTGDGSAPLNVPADGIAGVPVRDALTNDTTLLDAWPLNNNDLLDWTALWNEDDTLWLNESRSSFI